MYVIAYMLWGYHLITVIKVISIPFAKKNMSTAIGAMSLLLKTKRGHASVRLPGVLHTNVGHSKFGYSKLKKSYDLT